MKKLVMILGNTLRSTGISLAKALTNAWASLQLKKRLETTDERGEMIRFIKDDGTERWALATRNLAHIPADKHPKNGKPDSTTSLTVRFFDLFEGAWRSFRADRLIIEPKTAA